MTEAQCLTVSPSGTACDKLRGHQGQHHARSADQTIDNLVYDERWDDGFIPAPPAVFINSHDMFTTAVLPGLRNSPLEK